MFTTDYFNVMVMSFHLVQVQGQFSNNIVGIRNKIIIVLQLVCNLVRVSIMTFNLLCTITSIVKINVSSSLAVFDNMI